MPVRVTAGSEMPPSVLGENTPKVKPAVLEKMLMPAWFSRVLLNSTTLTLTCTCSLTRITERSITVPSGPAAFFASVSASSCAPASSTSPDSTTTSPSACTCGAPGRSEDGTAALTFTRQRIGSAR